MRHFLLLIFIIIFSFSTAVTNANDGGNSAGSSKSVIVTSTQLLKHVVEKVSGSEFEVYAIYPNNVDPHHFEPTPADMKKVESADLVIIHGLGYDDWVLNLSGVDKGKLLNLGERISFEEKADVHHHAHDHDHGHDHDSCELLDSHVWMNPKYVIEYAEHITTALQNESPAQKDFFQSRSDLYQTNLKVLDSWIKRQMAGVSKANRKVLVDHNSLTVFGETYGIEIKSLAMDHYAEVDMKTFKEISAWVNENQVKVLLVSSLRDSESFMQIQEDLNLASVEKYYVDQMPDSGVPTYEEMMVQNTLAIVDALH